MDVLTQIILGLIFALILHELTHLIVIFYYKIPLKALVVTKWTAFGFLVDNEQYVNDNRKLLLLHFLPLVWCLPILLNPQQPYLMMFPIVNIFGGTGDIYNYIQIVRLPVSKRVETLNTHDEKILKSIIWKKELSNGK